MSEKVFRLTAAAAVALMSLGLVLGSRDGSVIGVFDGDLYVLVASAVLIASSPPTQCWGPTRLTASWLGSFGYIAKWLPSSRREQIEVIIL